MQSSHTWLAALVGVPLKLGTNNLASHAGYIYLCNHRIIASIFTITELDKFLSSFKMQ